uniref:Uncharacterized protein n=1 Tax=Ditylenchus dipsaci TaxID=166011 RepID=A0A915EMA0_9BILA
MDFFFGLYMDCNVYIARSFVIKRNSQMLQVIIIESEQNNHKTKKVIGNLSFLISQAMQANTEKPHEPTEQKEEVNSNQNRSSQVIPSHNK